MQRLRYILRTTANIEHKRLTPHLIRFGVLLFLFLPVLLISTFAPDDPLRASIMQMVFQYMSMVAAVLVAGYAAIDSGGEQKNPAMALIALTGISAREWCFVRLLEMLRIYLLIMSIRLPIILWIRFGGGYSWGTICSFELLSLAVFFYLSAFGIMQGAKQAVTGAALGMVVLGAVIWELCCNVIMLTGLILPLVGWQLSPWLMSLSSILSEFSVFHRLQNMTTLSGEILFAAQVACLIAAGVLCFVFYSRLIFAEIGSNTIGIEGQTETNQKKKKKRPPCWDDALAWQSFHYHHGGNSVFWGRAMGYVALFIVILVMNFYRISLDQFGSFLFAASGLFFTPIVAANVCLASEMKEQTLSSLCFAAADPVELYKGWQRGGHRMGRTDLLMVPAICIALSCNHHLIGFVAASVVLFFWALAPLFFISCFLAAWTKANVINSAKIFGMMLLIGAVSVLVGWLVTWYIIPFIALPLSYGMSQYLLHYRLRDWFDPLLAPKGKSN